MRNASLITLLLSGTVLAGCSLAPDFTVPEMPVPQAYKEGLPDTSDEFAKGQWKTAESMESSDRGQWWTIFGDERLNAIEQEAMEANQSLKAAAARLDRSRALAESNTPSYLPDLDIGGNAVRSKPAGAALAAFGNAGAPQLKPYNLYSAQGVLSYEADLFGNVRDNYSSFLFDSQAEAASYRSMLLALQADVAQYYFSIRALDAERKLLRETVNVRTEAARIMQRRFEVGSASEIDTTRTRSELAGIKAELVALDSQRRRFENALAVLLGKMPSDYHLEEAPLEGMPPLVPAGLTSELLQRRPDIAGAIASMQAANKRIGVARTAFFPRLILTASGGYQSTQLDDLFDWSGRTWALGQTAGASALVMSIFDSGRNFSRLDASKAAYAEAVANYRQQVLLAFRDVEDSLTSQRLLAEQSQQQEVAADAASRTTYLVSKRYDEGDVDYFQVVDAQRVSLAAERAAVQVQGQRYFATVALIRALGGGWETQPAAPAETSAEEATPPAGMNKEITAEEKAVPVMVPQAEPAEVDADQVMEIPGQPDDGLTKPEVTTEPVSEPTPETSSSAMDQQADTMPADEAVVIEEEPTTNFNATTKRQDPLPEPAAPDDEAALPDNKTEEKAEEGFFESAFGSSAKSDQDVTDEDTVPDARLLPSESQPTRPQPIESPVVKELEGDVQDASPEQDGFFGLDIDVEPAGDPIPVKTGGTQLDTHPQQEPVAQEPISLDVDWDGDMEIIPAGEALDKSSNNKPLQGTILETAPVQ